MDRLCNYHKPINQRSSALEKTGAPCWERPGVFTQQSPLTARIDVLIQTRLSEERRADCCAFMASLYV